MPAPVRSLEHQGKNLSLQPMSPFAVLHLNSGAFQKAFSTVKMFPYRHMTLARRFLHQTATTMTRGRPCEPSKHALTTFLFTFTLAAV